MVFYLYDLDRCANELRGFYLPIGDVPGPIVTTQEDLVAALRDPDLPKRDSEQRSALNARMSPHEDGQCSRRVLDLLQEF